MFLSCVSNKVRAFDTPLWAIALGEIDQFGALSAECVHTKAQRLRLSSIIQWPYESPRGLDE
jgi:hypothetical protein